MTETRELAAFIVKTDYNDLPLNVQRHAKLCILDWLGAALAGSIEPPAKIIYAIMRELGGKRESTIIGAHSKTGCVNAALANGIIGHTVELDDVHELSIIHPAAPVIPAALAIGERCDSSGQDFMTAVVLGYEVGIRIGSALNPSHYQYWHTTGTCGTFGAAATAGKLLGLDVEEMIQALGMAGTQAAGLVETFGTMSKPLNPGKAAQSGVLAALLAQRGFTSSKHTLDSKIGYCYAASNEPKIGEITEELGKRFAILRTSFKCHASCGHTHGAIDAVASIASKHHITPDMVEEVVVETYPIAMNIVGNKPRPVTSSDAKFSLHYCLAAALVFGRVGLEEFSEKRLNDTQLRELSGKIVVKVGQEFAKAVLGSARVTVRVRDGREMSFKVNVPKGYPDNPLTASELKQKFRRLASVALSKREVEKIILRVENLDRIHVSALASLL
ncbi:MAG: MmgE/PrpD family protein [Candidatus Bathyarchaeia archaeon]